MRACSIPIRPAAERDFFGSELAKGSHSKELRAFAGRSSGPPIPHWIACATQVDQFDLFSARRQAEAASSLSASCNPPPRGGCGLPIGSELAKRTHTPALRAFAAKSCGLPMAAPSKPPQPTAAPARRPGRRPAVPRRDRPPYPRNNNRRSARHCRGSGRR